MTETPTPGAYEALIEEADYAALCAQPGSDLRGLLNRLSTALRFSEQERAEMARELEQAHADSRRMRKLEARMSRSITLANEIIALGKGSRDDALAEHTGIEDNAGEQG